uniref:Teratocyte protein VI n=1 Tax=Cotesia flavipes TaxID=89805 RepID=A0A8K1YTV8_COTFL|nr:teratocyte protein VI [Cotesia flavipes]
MNSALSFLFLALVVGLATGNPAPQDPYSSIRRPNVSLTYNEANGVQIQRIVYSGFLKGFPSEWTAEFINPVARPNSSDHILDILLAHMDEGINWSLTPNLSRPFNAWNVQMKIPREWKINHSMGQNFIDINGSLMATVYLMPPNAGTKIIQSHFGNYLDIQPVALEVDLTTIVSIIYNNNKLLVSFSTRRQKH